jgi:hypothetical protein
MNRLDTLTHHANEEEPLVGSPIFDDRGQLVAVMNDEHERVKENAARFCAGPLDNATARRYARIILGRDASELAVSVAASLLVNAERRAETLRVVASEGART